MNASDPLRRVRGPPNGSSMGPGARPTPDIRNGSAASVATSMSRAEKFEDEKKRIIESCFGKREPDGSNQVSESYITHIRIIEDAAFPSSPPPAQSPSENKKPRIIVVAVRKSGRVRVHKARENANGSFSIGKTWNLDDLTKIESYNNSTPTSTEEHQIKERAGETGFIVTIQKPYYWQASTAKEKDFFIFSLIKIYKKYTGGKQPELSGFDPQELEQHAGASSAQPSSLPGMLLSPEVRSGTAALAQDLPPAREGRNKFGAQSNQPNGRDIRSRPSQRGWPSQESLPQEQPRDRRPSSERPSQERQSQEPRLQGRQLQERQSQERKPPERHLRAVESDDRIRRMPGQFPSSEFVRNVHPQSSQPQLKTQRSESPANLPGRGNGLLQQDPRVRTLAGTQSTESFQSSIQNESNTAGSRTGSSIGQRSMTPEQSLLPPGLRSGRTPTSNTSQDLATELETPSVSHSDLGSAQRDPRSNSMRNTIADIDVPPNRNTDHMREPQRSDNSGAQGFNDLPTLNFSPPLNQPMPANNTTLINPQAQTAINTGPHANQVLSSGAPLTTSAANNTTGDAATPIDIATPLPPPEPTTEEEAMHRPGLGPMIKKKSNKEIANTFRKAATAYNAFKPRAGGAAEKLQLEKDKVASGPDGISGVFPAPSLLRGISLDTLKTPTPDHSSTELTEHPVSPEPRKDMPTVKITTSPPEAVATSVVPPVIEVSKETPPPDKPPVIPEKAPEEQRRKRQSNKFAKYAKALNIDPGLLEGRTHEIDSILDEFGWEEGKSDKNTFEKLQTGIRKELARVEAGSWLGAIESNDERVTAVGEMMDRVIAECDELDCLLTLYNVELGSLSEDVAYIEAQSQGLQVQTANQKLLHTELKSLLETISISATELQVLKDASLAKPQGLHAVETTLAQLYTAMLTIDPRLRSNGTRPSTSDQLSVDRRDSGGFGGSQLSSMRAVREKKDGYCRESSDLVQRLKQFMSIRFRDTQASIIDAIEKGQKGVMSTQSTKLDHCLRQRPKQELWLYSPLMLFAREVEPAEWEDVMRMYENFAKKPYADEFRNNMFTWKRITRKTVEDQDVLFTTQEKESEGSIVGRKLTVKRSKTIRVEATGRISSSDKSKDGKVTAYEAFAGSLSEMSRMIFVEQNFVVDLFHLTSLDNTDFLDAVATKPELRKGGDPLDKKLFDPDRSMAAKVTGVMEGIYGSWPGELQNLVDWVIKQDALQGVGVLFALESQLSELEETNQEFLMHAVTKVHDRLAVLFGRFVDEQIRGIEDTKVKIKKRKGVIAFMKTFPNFSLALENMLPPTRTLDQLPIRTMVNTAYHQLNKAMFESLKFIAKESPVAGQQQGGDPEDKEALNYHILLIENMNHYIEEVAVHNNPVLDDWKSRALLDMTEHMDLYLSAVIRRPLGKLLDFLESTEYLRRNNAQSPTSIATRASHSRSIFKKLLSTYDAKEIRRGIETLRKRVEKHFGDADDPGLSRGLVAKVLRECEIRYLDVGERVERVATEVYEGVLEVEWKREDVVAAFKR